MLTTRKALLMLSAIGMGLCFQATAASNQPVQQEGNTASLFVPHIQPGFEMGIAALWLRPGASNLNYAIYNKALPLLQPSWTEHELDPTFSPAFELDMRYAFPHAGGKDISLDWTHLKSDTVNASITALNTGDFVGPDYDIGPDGSNIQHASGAATFDADVANLVFGQYLNFGQHFSVRFFGGLGTAFLTEKLNDVYSGIAPNNPGITSPGPFSVSQFETSRFSGAGPRLGIDTNYNMNCGFGFLGEAGASLLMGNQSSNTNYLGTSQTLIDNGYAVPNPQYIADQHVFGVVPGFDAKLGVDYKHPFHDSMLLTISAGYQAAVYINAISQYLPGTLVPTKGISTGSIYVVSMNHVLSNYSLQGPFLKLSLHF